MTTISKTILFRGDSTRIAQFDVHRTKKTCLLGRGIYLTDSFDVARSYRTKDIPSYLSDKLSDQLCTHTGTKEEARAMALVDFYKRIDPSGNFLVRQYKGKIDKKHADMIVRRWNEIQDKLVYKVNRDINDPKKGYWTVSLPLLPSVGFVSTFEFPSEELQRNTLNVHRTINDKGIVELFMEYISDTKEIREKLHNAARVYNHAYSRFDGTIPSLLHLIRYATIEGLHKNGILNCNRMTTILMPYGYVGVRYDGGITTGNKRHQVYVLWDNNFVNSHRIPIAG